MTNLKMSTLLENLNNDEKLNHMRRMMTQYKIGFGYINEAEDPMAGGADPAAGADPMAGGADPTAGADPMAGGADPMAGGADPMAGGAPMGGAAPMAGGAPMGGAAAGDPNAAGGQEQGVETNLEPQQPAEDPNAGAAADAGMDEEPDEDVEEIDVDELTDSQEESEKKIDGLNSKFEKLLSKFDDFERAIADNGRNIETLKAEIEKRNPTAQERAQQRVNLSSPYGVAPEEFEPKLDPEVSATPEAQYVLTDKDIEGSNDWNNIAKSMERGFSLKDILDM